MKHLNKALAHLLVLSTLCLGPALFAQTVRYSYDGDGRLIQVIHADGSFTTYEYDDANNIVRVTNSATQGFSITSYTPQSGVSGSGVTITGQGLANPTVAFNGIPATITANSTTSIMTTVPAGATTGNLTVTVGAQTKVAGPFTILTAPPTLGIYSLPVAEPGSVITLAGSNFDLSSPAANVVRVGGTLATVQSVSATAITFVVPPIVVANNPPGTPGTAATVTVQTLAGETLAPKSLYLVPNIAFQQTLTPGQSVSGVLNAYGDNGLTLVQGNSRPLQIQVSPTNVTGTGFLYIFVFTPNNTLQQTVQIPTSPFGPLANGSLPSTVLSTDFSQNGQYVVQSVFSYDLSRGFLATGTLGSSLDNAPTLVNGIISIQNPIPVDNSPIPTTVNGIISVDNPNSIFGAGSPVGVNGSVSVYNSLPPTPTSGPFAVNESISVFNSPPPAPTSGPSAVNDSISIYNAPAGAALSGPYVVNESISIFNSLPLSPTPGPSAVNESISVFNSPPPPATTGPVGVNAVISTCNPNTGTPCP